MNEHEILKYICDNIWYEINKEIYYIPKIKDWFEIWRNTAYADEPVVIDVREIIFTPEFMNKFAKYKYNNWEVLEWKFAINLLNNLHDPVWYLYYLIKIIW